MGYSLGLWPYVTLFKSLKILKWNPSLFWGFNVWHNVPLTQQHKCWRTVPCVSQCSQHSPVSCNVNSHKKPYSPPGHIRFHDTKRLYGFRGHFHKDTTENLIQAKSGNGPLHQWTHPINPEMNSKVRLCPASTMNCVPLMGTQRAGATEWEAAM